MRGWGRWGENSTKTSPTPSPYLTSVHTYVQCEASTEGEAGVSNEGAAGVSDAKLDTGFAVDELFKHDHFCLYPDHIISTPQADFFLSNCAQ